MLLLRRPVISIHYMLMGVDQQTRRAFSLSLSLSSCVLVIFNPRRKKTHTEKQLKWDSSATLYRSNRFLIGNKRGWIRWRGCLCIITLFSLLSLSDNKKKGGSERERERVCGVLVRKPGSRIAAATSVRPRVEVKWTFRVRTLYRYIPSLSFSGPLPLSKLGVFYMKES